MHGEFTICERFFWFNALLFSANSMWWRIAFWFFCGNSSTSFNLRQCVVLQVLKEAFGFLIPRSSSGVALRLYKVSWLTTKYNICALCKLKMFFYSTQKKAHQLRNFAEFSWWASNPGRDPPEDIYLLPVMSGTVMSGCLTFWYFCLLTTFPSSQCNRKHISR